MQHLEYSGTPVLYIGRTVLKGCVLYVTLYTVKLFLPCILLFLIIINFIKLHELHFVQGI
jgi:hypothetical protein